MNGEPNSTPLSEIAKIRSGGTPSKRNPEYWGGEIPWVSAKDMKHAFIYDAEDHLTEVGVKNGTKVAEVDEILILVRGMTLHHDVPTCRVKKAAAFNQDVKAIAAIDVDPLYLFYAMRGSREELLRRVESAGHGTGRIPGDHLSTLPIPRFGKKEERRIASLLGNLDDKIELNRRMSATLEEMARALYRSWFVDFDPVHARALGQPPAHMDPTTAALFPDSFGPDGLPKGWAAGEVGDLITLQRGFDLPKKTRQDGPYPVMAAGGHHGTHNEFKVKGPGITTGRSGVIGQVYLVVDDFWPLNTSLWIKEFKGCSPYFAYFFLGAIDLAVLNSGSAVPSLNRNNVHNLIADIPPGDIIEKFDELVSPMFARQHQLNSETETIATLRDTLLPRLMSGDLRIREAEKQVEEAV